MVNGISNFFTQSYFDQTYAKVRSALSPGTTTAQKKASLASLIGTSGASTAQSALLSMKKTGSTLRASLSGLTGLGSKSVFKQTAVASDKPDILTVSSDASKLSPSFKLMTVEVSRLATKQENRGGSLSSTGRDLAAGRYDFALDRGGKSYYFSAELRAGDTNLSSLSKMAAAVNQNAAAGVTASVETKDGASRLVLSSRDTGENNAFALRDLAGGMLISQTGANQNTLRAQDAAYTVDGAAKTSASNTVTLAAGLSATFKSADTRGVTVSASADENAVLSAVKGFVSGFNEGLSQSTRLSRELSALSKTYSRSLSAVGIDVAANGSLSVRDSAVKSARQSGALQSLFTSGGSTGFAARVQAKAQAVERAPMQFLDQSLNTYGQSNSLFIGLLFSGSI